MAKWMVHDLWQSGWFKIYGKVDGSRFMKEWMVQKMGREAKKAAAPRTGGGEGKGKGLFCFAPHFIEPSTLSLILNHPLCHKS